MRATRRTGKPSTRTPAAVRALPASVIKRRSGLPCMNLTTGGSADHDGGAARMRPAATFKPEVASLNMGSMNFGLFGMLGRFKEFKHEWERELPGEQAVRWCSATAISRHRVHPDHLGR
jgi:uncharacterized protein (DUF849 family)